MNTLRSINLQFLDKNANTAMEIEDKLYICLYTYIDKHIDTFIDTYMYVYIYMYIYKLTISRGKCQDSYGDRRQIDSHR
jgi:hypothetical protein